jgi:hypothetical protein
VALNMWRSVLNAAAVERRRQLAEREALREEFERDIAAVKVRIEADFQTLQDQLVAAWRELAAVREQLAAARALQRAREETATVVSEIWRDRMLALAAAAQRDPTCRCNDARAISSRSRDQRRPNVTFRLVRRLSWRSSRSSCLAWRRGSLDGWWGGGE